jgi:hypothetical protein
MQNIKLLLLACLIYSSFAVADMEYHKNTLLGGRASTMAGAYTAISDDASGAFYNPAGLSYATSSSFSGSANTYSTTNSVYKSAIDNKDWERTSANLKPNFFGVVQKQNNQTFAFSYAVTDSMIEHQDQVFQGLTGTVSPIDLYALNIHSEDNTYLIGPSYSKKISSHLSWGVSAFYHYRVFRRAQSQLIRYSDGDDEASYLNNTKKEKGVKPKLGIMYSPGDKWSFGATVSKTAILTSQTDTQQNQKLKGAATYSFAQQKSTNLRNTPLEFETGAAYFYSSFLLFSANLDYYHFDDNQHNSVFNLSFASEYYLSEKHAIRGGLYTNRSNSLQPSNSTKAPLEHIDMYGLTAGYTLYAQSTAITFGTILSTGRGKAQIYTGSSATTNVSRTTMDFVVSADYGF